MKTDYYRTIKSPSAGRLVRRGSRFIALAYPVASIAEIKEILKQLKRRYHDATHHCYAYRLLTGQDIVARAADAGEPANSAGPPILQVLEHLGLLNVLVVVVRYFGGTKLGIGGLIRAYSDATKAALAAAEIVERVSMSRLQLSYPAELTGEVLRLVNRHRAEIIATGFAGRPTLTIALPTARLEGLQRDLMEATAGRVEFSRLEN